MFLNRLTPKIRICSCAKLGPLKTLRQASRTAMNGDLNNIAAERLRKEAVVDSAYHERSFAIGPQQDDPPIRKSYRPFLVNDELPQDDWISKLELSAVLKMVESLVLNAGEERLRVLVLHGSMRSR